MAGTDLIIGADALLLATAGFDHTARLWDLSALNSAVTSTALKGHTSAVIAVEFSADGRWLITASWDGTARRWDLAAENLNRRPSEWRQRDTLLH